MISHDLQCIFIHIPKTAGTSIERKLGHFETLQRGVQDHRPISAFQPLQPRDLLRHPPRGIKTAARHTLRLARRLWYPPPLSRRQFETYYKFTVVRNPWSRAFSWYRNVMRDPQHQRNLSIPADCPFDEFLALQCGRDALQPQTHWIRGHFGDIPFDRICRFEQLADEFPLVAQALGLPDPALPRLITGDGEDYRDHYTSATRRFIAEHFAEEIELFSFQFGE